MDLGRTPQARALEMEAMEVGEVGAEQEAVEQEEGEVLRW